MNFKNKTNPHSHIKSLYLDSQSLPQPSTFIGQTKAREAAGLLVDLVISNSFGGHAILLVGPSGSGKSALANALSAELKTKFTCLSATEIYSKEVTKTEFLKQTLRYAIKLKLKEEKWIYEGEVISINLVEKENKYKIRNEVQFIDLTLRTLKETRIVKLDGSLFAAMEQENIKVGDIVYVETNGIVKRIGRSEAFINENDLEADNYVPLPKDDVFKKRMVEQEFSLHELDLANTRPNNRSLIGTIKNIVSSKLVTINERVRIENDKLVDEYVNKGLCKVGGALLMIEDAHRLDKDCFSYLHKLMEETYCPLLIFSTNKKFSNENKLFGMPDDFLDRLVVIRMEENDLEVKKEILKCRLNAEGVKLSEEAFLFLIKVVEKNGLRKAINLIGLLKDLEGEIGLDRISMCTNLFTGLS